MFCYKFGIPREYWLQQRKQFYSYKEKCQKSTKGSKTPKSLFAYFHKEQIDTRGRSGNFLIPFSCIAPKQDQEPFTDKVCHPIAEVDVDVAPCPDHAIGSANEAIVFKYQINIFPWECPFMNSACKANWG